MTARHEHGHTEHEKKVSVFEDSKYEPKANPLQRIIALGLLLAGVAIVVLGGYYLYNRNNKFTDSAETENLNQAPVQQPLLDTVVSKPDTVAVKKEPESYKFVLETKNSKLNAFKRYNQLKTLPTDIRMETTDSINFKLYFILPGTAKDTSRIKDSLNNYYGRRVKIEL
jgi:hypothetical protein